MNSLVFLRSLLFDDQRTVQRPLTDSGEIDHTLRLLEARTKGAALPRLPLDLQYEAVRQFWTSMRVESLRDARLVSFGLCLPSVPGGPCVLDDGSRFSALLGGLERWLSEPRRYRRCYQGLVANYFGFDGYAAGTSTPGGANWIALRHYLDEHSSRISDDGIAPHWVTCVIDNRQLFGESPCDAYSGDVLRGDTKRLEWVCGHLGIDGSSWFLRELVLALVTTASKEDHPSFVELIPKLLQSLERAIVVRDRGMVALLDRHSRIPARPFHKELCDCAVQWWGNPWLSSNRARWGGVSVAARDMVAEWLKLEFIETFFTLLAEEGKGDRRRLEFWKRYVNAIDDIHFALGADARGSHSRDFVEIRKKMTGRTVSLTDTVSSNNAFVMTMGDLVVVEFSGRANALYGYDRRQGLPFDLTKAVVTPKNSHNSLKNNSRRLWLKHADEIRGWSKWEQMFEATLRSHFGIEPTGKPQGLAPAAPAVQATTPVAAPISTSPKESGLTPTAFGPLGRGALEKFAYEQGLVIEDNTPRGGNLWLRTQVREPGVDRVLSAWGFKFKPGKGWWR